MDKKIRDWIKAVMWGEEEPDPVTFFRAALLYELFKIRESLDKIHRYGVHF